MGGGGKETEQIPGKTINLLRYAEEGKKKPGEMVNHQKANDKFLHNH